jgi:3',5'-cyclic-AMP phosphodiesterase
MPMSLTRRDILVGLPGLAAGYAVAQISTAEASPKPFRVAHLTDLHVRPGEVPERGLIAALKDAHKHGIDLIVNGGDAILDALQEPLDSVNAQWAVFDRIMGEHCRVPLLNVVGNHDIHGWGTEERKEDSKQRTLDRLKLDKGYYRLERGGWKLIVLDSVAWSTKRGPGYLAALGQEQFYWLASQLKENTLPCCIISHIPILSASSFFDGFNEQSGNWVVPGEWMHLDARSIKNLFKEHPEVKLCISGHIHLVDRLEYLGVNYFCNGAVCGNYWQGAMQEFPPAYALVDLYPDGTFENKIVTY